MNGNLMLLVVSILSVVLVSGLTNCHWLGGGKETFLVKPKSYSIICRLKEVNPVVTQLHEWRLERGREIVATGVLENYTRLVCNTIDLVLPMITIKILIKLIILLNKMIIILMKMVRIIFFYAIVSRHNYWVHLKSRLAEIWSAIFWVKASLHQRL